MTSEPNRHWARSPKRPKSELRNVVKGDKQTYIHAYKHWLERAVVLSWQEWLYQFLTFPKGRVNCFRMWDFWLQLLVRFLHSPCCNTYMHTYIHTNIGLDLLFITNIGGNKKHWLRWHQWSLYQINLNGTFRILWSYIFFDSEITLFWGDLTDILANLGQKRFTGWHVRFGSS